MAIELRNINPVIFDHHVGVGATTFSQRLTVADTLAITNEAGQQYLLMGNRDSFGENNPAIIEAANGSLHFGGGTSWVGSGGTMRYTMSVKTDGKVGIGTTEPAVKLDVRGVAQAQNYPITHQISAQWVKIGTLTAPQAGFTAHIRAYFHEGYNAANIQDFYTDIFFKTSNTASVDANGFGANSWYYSTGFNSWDLTPKWVANAAGCNATAYDLYLYVPSNVKNSYYAVDMVEGVTWTHLSIIGQADPGLGSSTVCVSSVGFNLPLGNVGIGTTSPLAKVHVESSNSQGDNKGLIYLKSTSGANVLKIGVDGTNNFSELRAYTPGAGDNSKLILQPYGGNVGIGTTSPACKLHVVGHRLLLQSPGGQTDIDIQSASGKMYGLVVNPGWAADSFHIYDKTVDAPRLTISSTGNVGIDTTSPACKLHVAGHRLLLQSSGGQTDIDIQSASGKMYGLVINPGWAADSFHIYDKTLDASRLTVSSAGNVGIGVLSPTQKLHVAGNLKIDGRLMFNDGSYYPSANTASARVMACPIDGARGVYDNDVLWMWDGRLTQPSYAMQFIGTNGAYSAGANSYTANSRISFVGGASKTYTGYETSAWNYNYMMQIGNTTVTSGTPAAYAVITLPCDQNFHNVFHVKIISGDRHTALTAHIANSGGVIQKKLQSRSNGSRGIYSYICDVGPRNTIAKSEDYHAWMSFTIPKTFLQSYSFVDDTSPTGRSVKIALNAWTHNADGATFFISGLAISRNPTGFCYVDALDMHWTTNGGNGIVWHSDDWNNASLAYIPANTEIYEVRLPIAGTDKDVLVSLIQHNDTWNGTTPMFTLQNYYNELDRPNAVFRLSHFNTGTYGAAYGGARSYQKSIGFIVPKELVAAHKSEDHFGALQLKFRIWHRNVYNNFYIRGAYTEQVNRIGNDKTFAGNAMNMKNNNFKSSDLVNLETNDSV